MFHDIISKLLLCTNKAIHYIGFLLLCNNVYVSISTKEQCQKDCQATGCPLTYTNASRLLGPTRPFQRYDILGAPLSLTRPYPYAIAAEEIMVVTVHVYLTVHMLPDPNGDDVEGANNTTVKLTASESSCIISILSRSVESFQCVHITIPQEQQVNRTNNRTGDLMRTSAIVEMKIRYSGKEVRTHGMNVNRTAVNDWFSQSLFPTMIGNLHLNDTSSQYLQRCLKDHATTSIDGNSTTTTRIAYVSLDDGRKVSVEDTISLQSYDKALATPLPNPYSPFCEVGCELFYTNTTKVQKRQTSSSTGLAQEPISLDGCRHLCDTLYSYNLSVGYNDLMEVARLECHDGCFIGWKRCQPGYYCSTKTTIISMGNTPAAAGNSTSTSTSLQQSQVGGIMIPCPPGTYREVSYLATDKCVPCPPGRYRSELMGTSLISCKKCPAGFYAPKFQSTSLQDCIRCPEGTFTKEEGSGSCICITPFSCAKPQ
jgi:hypothetical protein